MVTIQNQKLRNILRFAIPFLIIPATVFLGAVVFDEKKHLYISVLVAVFVFILFVAGFDRKQIGTRRMVIISVMIALSVVGRFIPFFKPITALTILTAMYLGGESGFAVGAFSALLSNFYFGQGPWTSFQMLSWGLIGLFAGFLATPLKKSKPFLLFFGVLSGITFSMVMDIWTLLWYNNGFSFPLFLSAVTASLPHTILYAVSNFLFLLLLSKPIGSKLQRIKTKYGI